MKRKFFAISENLDGNMMAMMVFQNRAVYTKNILWERIFNVTF